MAWLLKLVKSTPQALFARKNEDLLARRREEIIHKKKNELCKSLDEVTFSYDFDRLKSASLNADRAANLVGAIPALYHAGDYNGIKEVLYTAKRYLHPEKRDYDHTDTDLIGKGEEARQSMREVYNKIAGLLNLDQNVVSRIGEISPIAESQDRAYS